MALINNVGRENDECHEFITSLMAKMTLQEKIGQLSIIDGNKPLDFLLENNIGSVINVSGEKALWLQHDYIEKSRLGIPLLVTLDCVNGHSFYKGATVFPSQLAQSCTWLPELSHEIARVTSEEMHATGVHLTYSPVLDLSRDLRWGRTGETFGESTCLTRIFGEHMVKGYQASGKVACCAKHFLGYSDGVGGRDAANVDVSRFYIEEYLLPPFSGAIANGCASVMLGYHALNGVPCTTNSMLIEDILRQQLAFKGVVLTDWQNVDRLVDEHLTCKDDMDAAMRFIASGADLQMGSSRFLQALSDVREMPETLSDAIDNACSRVLTLKFGLGLFQQHQKAPDISKLQQDSALALAQKVADSSVILLKNTGVLPLKRGTKVLLTGDMATDIVSQLGDWCLGFRGQGDWLDNVAQYTQGFSSLLDGLLAFDSTEIELTYTKGASTADAEYRDAGFGELCTSADVIILCVGENRNDTGEMRDSAKLSLNQSQLQLLDIARCSNKPLITVFIGSKPLSFFTLNEASDAFVCAFNPGMYGGRAIAGKLLGKSNFEGKLSITIPNEVGQLPMRHDIPGIWHGDGRYFDLPASTVRPLFNFGFGLSFSTFSVNHFWLEQRGPEHLTLTVEVENLSTMEGKEVVQIYLREKWATYAKADLKLIGFKKATIPGLSCRQFTVRVTLSGALMSPECFNSRSEQERILIQVGNSSAPDALLSKSLYELINPKEKR